MSQRNLSIRQREREKSRGIYVNVIRVDDYERGAFRKSFQLISPRTKEEKGKKRFAVIVGWRQRGSQANSIRNVLHCLANLYPQSRVRGGGRSIPAWNSYLRRGTAGEKTAPTAREKQMLTLMTSNLHFVFPAPSSCHFEDERRERRKRRESVPAVIGLHEEELESEATT